MDAACTIQDSIHVFSLVRKYVSRILGTYQFAPSLTGPFCQMDRCLEGKMTCGRKLEADMTPEDILEKDYPALWEGGCR